MHTTPSSSHQSGFTQALKQRSGSAENKALKQSRIGVRDKLRDSAGFTLVELAISLVVIGLLIGGVLKGEELIRNARATQAYKKVQEYKAAATTFRGAYGFLPGDIPNAGSRLPGCTGVCATTAAATGTNGDNTIMGVGNTYTWAFNTVHNIRIDDDSEAANFWRHMGLVNMISPEPNTLRTARYVMKSPFSMGSFVPKSLVTASSAEHPFTMNGLYIFMIPVSGDGTTTYGGGANNNGNVLSPIQARQIDVKFDDGLPYTGNVLSSRGTSSNLCNSTTAYLTTDYTQGCPMAFHIMPYNP